MNSEFNKGAAYARDLTISIIIGMQNEIGNDISDERYVVLQKLMNTIEAKCGDMYSEFIG